MLTPLVHLREIRSELSPTEKTIADRILRSPRLVTEKSIHELAQETFSSSATILRLCRHLGFEGFRDFRQAVAYELAVSDRPAEQPSDLSPEDSLEAIIEKITYRNIAALELTARIIDPEKLQRCIQLISSARVVYLFGMGASLCTCKDAYLKLLRLNKIAVINEDWHSQLLQARNATPQDVGIVISYSGATVEMIECMKALKESGTPAIAITRLVKSPIAELADECLYTASNESLFRAGAMSSRISQLDIIDILFTALSNLSYEESITQISRTYIKKPGVDDEGK